MLFGKVFRRLDGLKESALWWVLVVVGWGLSIGRLLFLCVVCVWKWGVGGAECLCSLILAGKMPENQGDAKTVIQMLRNLAEDASEERGWYVVLEGLGDFLRV